MGIVKRQISKFFKSREGGKAVYHITCKLLCYAHALGFSGHPVGGKTP